MITTETTLLLHHQIVTDRFIAACQADARIVAAFLGGSYASGRADAHSDLDFYLITTDEAYDTFLAEKEAFVQQLGEPLFLENWGEPHGYLFILADGTEGDLWIGQESRFKQIHGGAYKVLVDKQGVLAGVELPLHRADPAQQLATLRQLIQHFWNEMSHFNKALAREQLWFAYGSLERMRHICVSLTRLQHNFADHDIDEDPFFKLEQAIPVERLAALQVTFCPFEKAAIRQAGFVILQFYRGVAADLATAHGIPYPAALDRLMVGRM